MSKDKETFSQKIANIFLQKSGIQNSFDKAYDTFITLSEQGVPLPLIAEQVAPHLRPVVKQFTGLTGKGKLMVGATLVNWKLNNISSDEIQGFIEKAKKGASKDVGGHSKDAVDVAQKFLNSLQPDELARMIDSNKGAVTPDMIEDIIVIAKAVQATLPPKLSRYLNDILPEVNDLEKLIRSEADALLKEDTKEQVGKVLKTAKEKTEEAQSHDIGDVQKTLVGKMDEIDAEMIKRIVDHIAKESSTGKLYGLMVSFFNFADEVITAFEDSSKPLRECKFKHGADYQGKLKDFLETVERALDAEGLLPDHLDVEAIKTTIAANTPAATPKAPKPKGP